jgi:hypothetical protein
MKTAHHTLTERLVHWLAIGEEQQIHQQKMDPSVDPEQKGHTS